MTFVVIVYC